jgi:hypothetical protein
MPKSESFAIATQQAHAAGKSPKGYGTSEGRREAKQKYDSPKGAYKKTADPSHKSKTASSLALWKGFADEIQKIAMTTPAHITAMARPKPIKMGATSLPRESPQMTPMKDPLSSTKLTTPPPVTAG